MKTDQPKAKGNPAKEMDAYAEELRAKGLERDAKIAELLAVNYDQFIRPLRGPARKAVVNIIKAGEPDLITRMMTILRESSSSASHLEALNRLNSTATKRVARKRRAQRKRKVNQSANPRNAKNSETH
jgi:hypothetical protein